MKNPIARAIIDHIDRSPPTEAVAYNPKDRVFPGPRKGRLFNVMPHHVDVAHNTVELRTDDGARLYYAIRTDGTAEFIERHSDRIERPFNPRHRNVLQMVAVVWRDAAHGVDTPLQWTYDPQALTMDIGTLALQALDTDQDGVVVATRREVAEVTARIQAQMRFVGVPS